MKYPKKLLSDDEAVVFDVHHHPVVLWKPTLAVVAFLALWPVAVSYIRFFRGGWALLAGAFILLALSAWLASRTVAWSHADFVLTDLRLIYGSGVVSRQARETPLSRIIDVSSYRGVLGRVFGHGDLVVKSEGESRPAPYLDMPQPDRLKIQILEQVNAARGSTSEVNGRSMAEEIAQVMTSRQPTQPIVPVPPERPPLYSEIVDQIDRLDGLRERGVLSEEEFRKAKEGLLSRLEKESAD